MSYPLLVLPFLALTLAATVATARRPRFGQRMISSALAAIALMLLTAVFDNLMIAADLYSYPAEHLSGLRVGAAPLEDFAYPLCAAFLVPAVWTLTERKRA
ncbi:lycopene cyclase domain-containing protein [Microbacterium terricola]|uniref:Lycopene cyclase domain-containing protein n=1 Tax=Microbacterium terricola TaxID=344163 RepID=A0ABM8DZE7_9MICO|nr:lycopene cyclase domain-containing protein [Microbacterium terricola]UYK41243.1 lycopene cyclase domain-containing protein [Microbacterium terricola]BDV30979.1 hypothetical protein Microterr_16390 [Microbacterium terricola]